jgi:ABC-type uncharacterized transport system substrate-binding protein
VNDRRKLIIALGAGALTAPFGTFAQQQGKPVRVGMLVSSTAVKYQTLEKIFIETLRDAGWIENRNVVYDRAYADDDESRLPLLAEDLVKRDSNLIFAPTNAPTTAALAKTRTIPIVFSAVANPVEDGFVKSLAHPGGNATGVKNIAWELGSKRLQLLKQALPKVTRVGLLVNPNARTGVNEQKVIEQAATQLRVKIFPVAATEIGEIEAAFAVLSKNRVEALLVTQQVLFVVSGRKHILAFASKYRIPVIGSRVEFTDEGGFMSYGSNLEDQTRRAAQIADKILKGAKPADIPVEQPTKFDLAINLFTAKAIGLAIPESFLLRADEVIE